MGGRRLVEKGGPGEFGPRHKLHLLRKTLRLEVSRAQFTSILTMCSLS